MLLYRTSVGRSTRRGVLLLLRRHTATVPIQSPQPVAFFAHQLPTQLHRVRDYPDNCAGSIVLTL